MIERLVTSVAALAAPEAQLARLAARGATLAELGLEFDDALLLTRQCQSWSPRPDQAAALARLERCLAAKGEPGRPAFWHPAALGSAEWGEVRGAAAAALAALRGEAEGRRAHG